MGQYDGKCVVITGGASGIGLATAKLLLNHGARVVVTGRTDATLGSAREEIGPDAILVKSDVAPPPTSIHVLALNPNSAHSTLS